jgi:uncharacterized protein (TIGR03086 family)
MSPLFNTPARRGFYGDGMSGDQLIGRAIAPVVEIVHNIKPDQLDAQTPCDEYDVRKLIHHLLLWGPSLEGAARKEIVPPPETEDDLAAGDWAAGLTAHLERTAAAWSVPEAWEGTTHMGGPTEMPAAMVGAMVMGEVLVHGWDLARATGQQPSWDADVLEYLHREVEASAEMGRQMGVYGPEVPVPADAPLLDRILGLTGRNPR